MRTPRALLCLLALPVALLALLGLAAGASAATLAGSAAVQAGADSNTPGRAEAFSAAAAASGQVTSLSVYVDASSTAAKAALGLYANAGGHAGALLTQGTIAAPKTGAWNTVTVPAATVTAGTTYWIALLGPSGQGTLAFRDKGSGGTPCETSASGALAALPSTWTAGTAYRDGPASAYASSGASTVPVLSVGPASLAFSATQGGAAPAAQSASVAEASGAALPFTIATDAAWLSATPASGTAPATVRVAADPAGLAAGSYQGRVTVSAPGATGSPATIAVSFTVGAPPPPPPPPPAGGADWLQIEHDATRSGFAPAETTISPVTAPNLAADWARGVDGKVTAAPLYAGGVTVGGAVHDVVVVATASNSVYALDATTGAVLWRRGLSAVTGNCAIPGGYGIVGSPAIDKAAGRLYVVGDAGDLRTLSLADGTDAAPALAVVDRPGTNKVWGGLNLNGGELYIATASDGCDSPPWRGRVVRVDVSGSAPRVAGQWDVVPSIPAPDGGGGIWGYGGVAVDPSSGHVYATPGADSNERYADDADRIVGLTAGLGVLGSFAPDHPTSFPCTGAPCDVDFGATPTVFTPAGCPTMLAVGNKNGTLYLIDTAALEAGGAPRQTLVLNQKNDWLGSGGVGGVPAYWPDGRMLVVTDAGPGVAGVAGGVVGLRVKADCTLEVAWSHALGGATQPNSTPTVANGVVVVGEGNGGLVHAYDAASGRELWSGGPAGGATYAAPIVAGGRIFAGSWDGFGAAAGGTVRAFRPGAAPPPPPPGTVLLGSEVVQAQVDSNPGGVAEAFQATASASGTLGSLRLYLDGSSTATKVVAGLYADAGGHPGDLVSQGSVSSPAAGGWSTVPLTAAAVTVTAGRPYWIAVLGTDTGTVRFRDKASGSCRAETNRATGLAALPGTWTPGAGYADCPVSAFAS